MTHENLWAPWRIGYIQGLSQHEGSDCFICDNLASPDHDEENLVVWRTQLSLVVLNRFPYNNGHLLIAPARHIPDLDDASDEEMADLMWLIRESQQLLSEAIRPHGFNVGMNFGRCAGAGLPGHLHIHVVPRWDGDTNFITTCSNIGVISQSLGELLALLRKIRRERRRDGS